MENKIKQTRQMHDTAGVGRTSASKFCLENIFKLNLLKY